MASETERSSGETKRTCRCCGYQIERTNLPISCNLEDLKFLGSGFPLFYNYVKYCLLILTVLFLTTSVYNIVTNVAYGHFCQPLKEKEASKSKHENIIETFESVPDNFDGSFANLEETEKEKEKEGGEAHEGHGCYLNWMSMLSLPNKKDTLRTNTSCMLVLLDWQSKGRSVRDRHPCNLI